MKEAHSQGRRSKLVGSPQSAACGHCHQRYLGDDGVWGDTLSSKVILLCWSGEAAGFAPSSPIFLQTSIWLISNSSDIYQAPIKHQVRYLAEGSGR